MAHSRRRRGGSSALRARGLWIGGGCRALAAVLLAGAALAAAGRPAAAQTRVAFHPHVLKAADYDANTYVGPPEGAGKTGAARTAVIRITFSDNFPAEARAAYEFAASIWETHLDATDPIDIEANWESLDSGTLGSAGPLLVANFPGAPVEDVWYPAALAESIAGEEFTDPQPDVISQFNSSFPDWYFGLDGNPPSGKYDFVTVVVHELGHGLGFTGSFDVEDGDAEDGDECPTNVVGAGCWGIASGGDVYPFIFDTFAEDAADVSLLNVVAYPNPSETLGDVLQSDALFFDGELSTLVNLDVPISLYAPDNFETGSSFSHLDESAFPPGTPNSLMTPFLARREVIHSPGPLTCAIMLDMGWELGADCQDLIGVDLPVDEEVAVDGPYPNPFADIVSIEVAVRTTQRVLVEVYDILGRRVEVVWDGVIASSDLAVFPIEGAAWPAGVYFVQITGETFRTTRSVVHVPPR